MEIKPSGKFKSSVEKGYIWRLSFADQFSKLLTFDDYVCSVGFRGRMEDKFDLPQTEVKKLKETVDSFREGTNSPGLDMIITLTNKLTRRDVKVFTNYRYERGFTLSTYIKYKMERGLTETYQGALKREQGHYIIIQGIGKDYFDLDALVFSLPLRYFQDEDLDFPHVPKNKYRTNVNLDGKLIPVVIKPQGFYTMGQIKQDLVKYFLIAIGEIPDEYFQRHRPGICKTRTRSKKGGLPKCSGSNQTRLG
jgi:hypothetical protein